MLNLTCKQLAFAETYSFVMVGVHLPKVQCTELHVWIMIYQCKIVLCSCIEHFTITLPLSTQVYNWLLSNLMAGNNTINKITCLYYVHSHWLIGVFR